MLTITNSWHLKFDSSCQNLWSLNTVIKFILDKTFDISQLSTSSSRSSTSCLLDILDNNLVYDNNHLRQWRHPHLLFNRQIHKSRQIAESPNRQSRQSGQSYRIWVFLNNFAPSGLTGTVFTISEFSDPPHCNHAQ